MTYPQLIAAARLVYLDERGNLLKQKAEEAIQELSEHPALGALLLALELRKSKYIGDVAAQKQAAHHGTLAHCAGSLHVLLEQEATLRQMLSGTPEPTQGAQRPEG